MCDKKYVKDKKKSTQEKTFHSISKRVILIDSVY